MWIPKNDSISDIPYEVSTSVIENAIIQVNELANSTGNIDKSDCIQLVKSVLEKAGLADKFNQ